MNKSIIAYGIGILLLLVGGVYLFQRPRPNTASINNSDVLEIQETDWVKGGDSATVTLVEYADFQCPACGAYYPLVKKMGEEYHDSLRIVARNFPLSSHRNAEPAARAAEAAGLQGKYWEMHDKLFEQQLEWSNLSNPVEKFVEYGEQIGLDLEKFQQDINSSSVQQKINNDVAGANLLRVNSTPTFFLNGEKIPNPQSEEQFKTLIDAAILTSKQTGQKVHEHANLAIYINGTQYDLSQAKYQSSEEKPLDPDLHLHDGVGHIIHKHMSGKTMGDFFKSLGMKFDSSCLELDNGQKYCNSGGQSLKFLVNGQANSDFANYEFSDLDKILISYGPANQNIQSQISAVKDDACIYSEKCPERGTPPTENCVGGLGSGC